MKLARTILQREVALLCVDGEQRPLIPDASLAHQADGRAYVRCRLHGSVPRDGGAPKVTRHPPRTFAPSHPAAAVAGEQQWAVRLSCADRRHVDRRKTRHPVRPRADPKRRSVQREACPING